MTRLKLSALLKRRIDRLARNAGETPHSLMVRALEAHVEAMERHEAFRKDAARAEKVMERSGMGV